MRFPPATRLKDAHVDSQRLGSVYSHLEACEPYVNGGRTCAEVAVVVDAGLGDSPGPAVIGAVRVLQQLRHQFDVVGAEAPLDGYKVVVVPGSTPIDQPPAGRLKAYVDGGGSQFSRLRQRLRAERTKRGLTASTQPLPRTPEQRVEPGSR